MEHMSVKGKIYPSLRAACADLGVRADTVRRRAATTGVSAAEAIEQVIKDKPRLPPIVVDGVTFISLAAACRAHGVSDSALRSQMKRHGVSAAEALKRILKDK